MIDTAVVTELSVFPIFPAVLPAGAEVRVLVDTDQDDSEFRTRMYMVLEEVS